MPRDPWDISPPSPKGWAPSAPSPKPAPPPAQKGWQSMPPPRISPPPVVPNNSGYYSRPSPPPSGGPGPMPQIAPPPAPPPPDITTYLGHDTTYQGQVRQYQKALADFLAQETQQRGKINEDYGSATKALGTQKTFDLNNMLQDFASRGLVNSGLYSGAVGDYNTNYLQQLNELTKGKRRSLADLLLGETNFRKEQTLQQQKAREDAIARRASQYGL